MSAGASSIEAPLDFGYLPTAARGARRDLRYPRGHLSRNLPRHLPRDLPGDLRGHLPQPPVPKPATGPAPTSTRAARRVPGRTASPAGPAARRREPRCPRSRRPSRSRLDDRQHGSRANGPAGGRPAAAGGRHPQFPAGAGRAGMAAGEPGPGPSGCRPALRYLGPGRTRVRAGTALVTSTWPPRRLPSARTTAHCSPGWPGWASPRSCWRLAAHGTNGYCGQVDEALGPRLDGALQRLAPSGCRVSEFDLVSGLTGTASTCSPAPGAARPARRHVE